MQRIGFRSLIFFALLLAAWGLSCPGESLSDAQLGQDGSGKNPQQKRIQDRLLIGNASSNAPAVVVKARNRAAGNFTSEPERAEKCRNKMVAKRAVPLGMNFAGHWAYYLKKYDRKLPEIETFHISWRDEVDRVFFKKESDGFSPRYGEYHLSKRLQSIDSQPGKSTVTFINEITVLNPVKGSGRKRGDKIQEKVVYVIDMSRAQRSSPDVLEVSLNVGGRQMTRHIARMDRNPIATAPSAVAEANRAAAEAERRKKEQEAENRRTQAELRKEQERQRELDRQIRENVAKIAGNVAAARQQARAQKEAERRLAYQRSKRQAQRDYERRKAEWEQKQADFRRQQREKAIALQRQEQQRRLEAQKRKTSTPPGSILRKEIVLTRGNALRSYNNVRLYSRGTNRAVGAYSIGPIQVHQGRYTTTAVYRINVANQTSCKMLFSGYFNVNGQPIKTLEWGAGFALGPGGKKSLSGEVVFGNDISKKRFTFQPEGSFFECR